MIFDKAYKILAIDDAKDSLKLLVCDLQEAGCDVITANSGDEAFVLLEKYDVDLILLDMRMPKLSGLQVLEILKKDSELQDIPVIILSAYELENEIVTALELGADDYVVKPYFSKVLLARMNNVLRLREKTKTLAYLAQTDFLTEINNRASFYQLAGSAINQAQRHKQNVVIAMFDIDLFKRVNDEFGHHVGDQVLKAFARCMLKAFRDYDIISRIGGEEFAVCFPDTQVEQALLSCERFRHTIENLQIPIEPDPLKRVKQEMLTITISGGLASSCSVCLDLNTLLKQADIAMYFAKESGRNKIINAGDLGTDILNNHLTSKNTSQFYNAKSFEQLASEVINTAKKCANKICADSSDNLTIAQLDKQLGMNNVLGDKTLYLEVLQMFYQDHSEDGAKLIEAIHQQDIQTAKHISHTLKGVAPSVGATALFSLVKEIDDAFNHNAPVDDALIHNFSAQLSLVMAEIKTILDKKAL